MSRRSSVRRSSTIMLHDSCTCVSVPLKWLLESITRASQISYSWKLQYHLWTRIQIILFMDVLFEFKYNQVKQSIFSWEEWSLFIYGSYAYYCSQLWDVKMVKSLDSTVLKKLFNLLKRTISHLKIFHTENKKECRYTVVLHNACITLHNAELIAIGITRVLVQNFIGVGMLQCY